VPIKIYLSQANQAHNAGPLGYTEKAGMNAISWSVAQLLKKDDRFLVRRNSAGNRVDTARENAIEANAWGANRYVALHSNAGMKGTIVFHHSRSPKGEQLAKALYRAVAGLSPGTETGDRVRTWDGLIEIHTPDAPAVLIELEAHDWKTGVQWLTTKRREIAKAVYEGICRGVGLEPLPAKPALTVNVLQVPVPARKPSWWPKLEAYLRQVK
jgi:N-acetylmuramoyl-L-alanine amidase